MGGNDLLKNGTSLLYQRAPSWKFIDQMYDKKTSLLGSSEESLGNLSHPFVR